MRFKYYLKGLGMGIIITTIIMAVSCMMHNNNLSDQEIIKKAMALGMIMPDSQDDSKNDLVGSQGKESQETERLTENEATSEPAESESEITEESEKPSESESTTETEEPQTQSPPQHVEVTQYVLHIVVGDVPRKIANELYDNGVIDDATACMKYLGEYCERNKKSIQVGSYTITKGMSYEEIAQMITKK